MFLKFVVGLVFMIFVAVENGVILRSPQILRFAMLVANVGCRLPRASINNFRIFETDSRTGKLETELRVHRMHDALETGSQRILRSLVISTTGAGGILCDSALHHFAEKHCMRDMRMHDDSLVLVGVVFSEQRACAHIGGCAGLGGGDRPTAKNLYRMFKRALAHPYLLVRVRR